MFNLFILCGVAVTAYILTAMFEIIIGYISAQQLKQQKKKRMKNDLYRFKLKQLYLFTESYYLELGYNREKAQRLAIKIVSKLDDELLIDNKYQLFKQAKNDGLIQKIS